MLSRTLCSIVLFGAVGCGGDLGQAIEDVFATAPEICTTYCEDLNSCTWHEADAADNATRDRASSDAIHRCVLDCAFFAQRGAHVYEPTMDEAGEYAYYVDEVVEGSVLEDVLSCLYERSLFRCDETDTDAPLHLVGAQTEGECDDADGCVDPLAADYGFEWTGSADGGVCEREGKQVVEAPFFR